MDEWLIDCARGCLSRHASIAVCERTGKRNEPEFVRFMPFGVWGLSLLTSTATRAFGLSLPLTIGLLTLGSTAYEYWHPFPAFHHDGPGILHLGMLVAADLRILTEPGFFSGRAGVGAQHVSHRRHCWDVLQ